jgi:hypothetical protein
LILQSLAGEAVRGVAEPEKPGLFRRLIQRMSGSDREVAASPPSAVTPALGYAMDQLDPDSFAVLRSVPVGGGDPVLRTGDVFVLQFSTSLPGQVRMENIDPLGRTTHMGTYAVLTDQLNRIPRDRGIQLQGQPGLERVRFYFQPCLHAPPLARPGDARWAGRLPPCDGTRQQQLMAAAQGDVVPRALVNLGQADPNMSFAAAADYAFNEVTVMDARIRHEPPP